MLWRNNMKKWESASFNGGFCDRDLVDFLNENKVKDFKIISYTGVYMEIIYYK